MPEINEILMLFGEVFEEYTIHIDYSGRGMFGKACIGFCCSSPYSILVDLTEYISTFEVMNIRQKLGRICIDSMGMDKIVYFPDITISKREECM